MQHITIPTPLLIGDSLRVLLDDDDVPTFWATVTVKNISICHNPTVDGSLKPYVLVEVDYPEFFSFNYSLYCANGLVQKLS